MPPKSRRQRRTRARSRASNPALPPFLQPRPDTEFFPAPFALNHATLAGVVFKEGRAGAFQKLVDDTLNAASAKGRFKLLFKQHAIAGLFRFDEVRSVTSHGYISYQEAAIVLVVRDTQHGGVYLFNPVIVLDSFLTMLAGREIYGYPKVMARITAPALENAAWKALMGLGQRGFVSGSVEVEGFQTAATTEKAGWRLIMNTALSSFSVKSLFNQSRRGLPAVLASSPMEFFNGLLLPESVTDLVGWDACKLILTTLLNGLRVDTVFLKQFPDVSSIANSCLCHLVVAPYRSKEIRSFQFCAGDLIFHSPVTFPLADAMGWTAGQSVHGQFGFIADMDWELGLGKTLG